MTSWTPKRTETLKRLWAEGYSASQIGTELGGLSRNAVIGKVHRLGIGRKAPKAPKFTKPKSKTVFGHEKRIHAMASHPNSVKTKKAAQPLPKQRKADKDRIGPTLEQLKDFMCRWPVGINANGEQMFCGEEIGHRVGTEGKQAYCCEHIARSKSQMSEEQRQQISERMKAAHAAGTAHKNHRKAA